MQPLTCLLALPFLVLMYSHGGSSLPFREALESAIIFPDTDSYDREHVNRALLPGRDECGTPRLVSNTKPNIFHVVEVDEFVEIGEVEDVDELEFDAETVDDDYIIDLNRIGPRRNKEITIIHCSDIACSVENDSVSNEVFVRSISSGTFQDTDNRRRKSYSSTQISLKDQDDQDENQTKNTVKEIHHDVSPSRQSHFTPWMARLGYKSVDNNVADTKDFFRCAGALISNRYVLTAAHCFPKDNYQISLIRLGEYDASTNPDIGNWFGGKAIVSDPVIDIAINLSSVIIHPEFNRPVQNLNDVALIRLPVEVQFSDWIRPICLPFDMQEVKPEDLFADKTAIVAGWGFGEFGDILHEAEMSLSNMTVCKEKYTDIDSEISESSQICLDGDRRPAICGGDSGGPAMLTHENRFLAVGIFSHGPLLCQGDLPGVYTWVPKYLSWILDNISA